MILPGNWDKPACLYAGLELHCGQHYLQERRSSCDLARIVQHNLDEKAFVGVVAIKRDCPHKLDSMHNLFPASPRLLMLLHSSLQRLCKLP